jgi:hypothetical protein
MNVNSCDEQRRARRKEQERREALTHFPNTRTDCPLSCSAAAEMAPDEEEEAEAEAEAEGGAVYSSRMYTILPDFTPIPSIQL